MMNLSYTVFAVRKDGRKVEVSLSSTKRNLRALKELLVMHSEEFDEETRLTQKHRSSSSFCDAADKADLFP